MNMIVALLIASWTGHDAMRSSEVAVMHGSDAVARFRARIEDHHLIVTATHKKGWHTYAMDNEQRALTALQGKPSLGIEQGIDIQVDGDLVLEGSWMQTKPSDFSKPELRWYSYGFHRDAFFVCRIKELTSDQIVLRLRGQACTDDACCQVNITLELNATKPPSVVATETGSPRVKTLLQDLVPVASRNDPASDERSTSISVEANDRIDE